MESRNVIPAFSVINGYEFHELIGSGGFAEVYKVKSINYESYFVAKVVHITDGIEQKWASFDNEVQSLLHLNHPHIIRMYDHFRDENRFFIILEFCKGGSLLTSIQKFGKLNFKMLMMVSRQLIEAIAYSHSKSIAHRDIKPANILFDELGRVKLADFGISVINDEQIFIDDFQCSQLFAAPEILDHRSHSPFASDMWSLGVTLCYMITAEYPWPKTNLEILKKAMVTCAAKLPSNTPLSLRKIISGCLRVDPVDRIDINRALKEIASDTKHIAPQSLYIFEKQFEVNDQTNNEKNIKPNMLTTLNGGIRSLTNVVPESLPRRGSNVPIKSLMKMQKFNSGMKTKLKTMTFIDKQALSND